MLNTQPYGGGLWHTWFDRDLGLAGRIVYKEAGSKDLKTKLIRIDKPIARIPNLAIHLTSGKEREGFSPNLHDHAKAILSMDPALLAMKTSGATEDSDVDARLHPALVQLMSKESGISAENIVDLELQLIDVQPSVIGGAADELIFSGRLDNLCSSYQIMRALIDGSQENIGGQPNVRMAMMFDHEEVPNLPYAYISPCTHHNTLYHIVHLLNHSLTHSHAISIIIILSTKRGYNIRSDHRHVVARVPLCLWTPYD